MTGSFLKNLREEKTNGAARVEEILAVLSRTYPDAGTALRFETPFQLLVAAMLSAQTTDRQVNKITEKLFKRYREPRDFALLTPEELAREIKGCGLYRSKSKHIIAASRILVEKYNSRVPQNLAELELLPGVGRKTANVVLNVAFGQPTLPVDTHVFRVSHRLGLARARTPEETEEELLAIIPENARRAFHHQLIAHGRVICTARRPRCGNCPLAYLCPSRSIQEKRVTT
ncbi:MAG: endonuclease [Thermoanaerobacter sp.]|nr:endonuclease [Thermoanaerobacter sp.]